MFSWHNSSTVNNLVPWPCIRLTWSVKMSIECYGIPHLAKWWTGENANCCSTVPWALSRFPLKRKTCLFVECVFIYVCMCVCMYIYMLLCIQITYWYTTMHAKLTYLWHCSFMWCFIKLILRGLRMGNICIMVDILLYAWGPCNTTALSSKFEIGDITTDCEWTRSVSACCASRWQATLSKLDYGDCDKGWLLLRYSSTTSPCDKYSYKIRRTLLKNHTFAHMVGTTRTTVMLSILTDMATGWLEEMHWRKTHTIHAKK